MRKLLKFYWIPILLLAVGGSWWLSIRAWDYFHAPKLLELPEYWYVIFLIPRVATEWWNSPIYFQIPYVISLPWVALKFYSYTGAANSGSRFGKGESK